jgi:hypothetical protein
MQPGNFVHRRLGDTVVVVDLASDRIYELNPSAARIWELATAGLMPSEICRRLRREFDGTEASIGADIIEAISWMCTEGLLKQDDLRD